jgi:conjugal transfer pilus assembly protein TraU
MALGGTRLPLTDRRHLGTRGRGHEDLADRVFYHYHIYAFPLLLVLELLTDARCNAGGWGDIDLAYISELDPTWASSTLAFFTQPEVSAVANTVGWAACPVDAASAMVGRPINAIFWCAGSWGQLYPLSGWTSSFGSLAAQTSHLATRSLAAMHRRGLARRTTGADTMCEAPLDFVLRKDQYDMSMLFPVAEANGRHPIGRSALIWGMGRQIPAVGEDAIYLLWRWRDCCTKLF